jgi:PAS domain-containing protein
MNCSARWAASPWHSTRNGFERDQALAALSEREARYRELFKANPQVMFVYEIRSLRFLAVNEAALAFYGYSREEMLDMALPDVEPPGIQAPPQPSPGGAATERNLAASGPTQTSEQERRYPAGGTDRFAHGL